jgi:large subunit ribosomal protein L24
MKIKTGDTVKVIAGKDRGKDGKVMKAYTRAKKVLIDNINMFKKHVKKTEQTPEGGLISVPRPLEISNVMLLCPKCKKPSRIGYRITDGKKERFCKSCKKAIN